MNHSVTRRDFLFQAGAAAGSILAGRSEAQQGTLARLVNPNILTIMVDQLRAPCWLTPEQQAFVDANVTPTISQRIRNKAISFSNYFAAAAACTPSRSCLLTGLYSGQTHMYQTGSGAPGLNPAFPTWGRALAALNPAYAGNVWWFGKWHLTAYNGTANPLLPYGFNTSRYPSAQYPSPDGAANEGSNGGAYPPAPETQKSYLANDADIASDFVAWMSQPKTQPWCATVSLVNPHDIGFYPNSFPPNAYPPPIQPVCGGASFPAPAGPPLNYVYSSQPTGWNYETRDQLAAKGITAQTSYLQQSVQQLGDVTDWADFLNWYYWLQHLADAQVKRVLDAVASAGAAANTIVVFTSDHGDYGGSHGMHGKGGATYEEAIRVPLYVAMPGGTAGTRTQLCSAVDFFGLICDLGTTGGGRWATQYPDLARRESLYNFIYNPTMPEQKRLSKALGNLPYVIHTTDEGKDTGTTSGSKRHAVCLRTRSLAGDAAHGAKLTLYNQWADGTTAPDPAVAPDVEFYNFQNNPGEMGNDALSSDPATVSLLGAFRTALGTYGTSSTGAIGADLVRPLTGTGTDGQPLRTAQNRSRQAYLNFLASGGCTA